MRTSSLGALSTLDVASMSLTESLGTVFASFSLLHGNSKRETR